MPDMTIGSKVAVKQLDQKHDCYAENIDGWRQIRLLYEGGSALAKNASLFLQQRPKEPAEVLAFRVSRFVHVDTMSTGIAWYRGKIERSPR